MKRFLDIKNLTRLSILNKPLKVQEINETTSEEYEDRWLIKAEKLETKRLRAWRHQLAR